MKRSENTPLKSIKYEQALPTFNWVGYLVREEEKYENNKTNILAESSSEFDSIF